MFGKPYCVSGVNIAIPAPDIPAKNANKKNSLFLVKKYNITAAEEKSHKCKGKPS